MPRKTAKARRGRSEGTVTQRSDGRWVAAVSGGYAQDGKRIRTWVSGATKEEALRRLDDAKRKLGQTNISVDTERTTVAEFFAAWLRDIICHTVRPRTLECYQGIVDRHIVPHIGREQLRRLSPLGLQRLYGILERKGLGPRSRQLVHVTLATALRRAVRLHLIDVNPVDGVDAPRVPKANAKVLTIEQADKLLANLAPHRLSGLFVVALTTGMRPGEILGLKWEDVDLKRATIAVRRTIEDHKGKAVIGEPKTAGSRRRIDIPKRCVTALIRHRERLLADGLRAADWVFPSDVGTPLGIRNLSRVFKSALVACDLPDLRLYDLRHTAATIALVAGVPLKVVSERLGHASIKITADTYQHVIPSLQRDAADRIDAAFGGESATSSQP